MNRQLARDTGQLLALWAKLLETGREVDRQRGGLHALPYGTQILALLDVLVENQDIVAPR